MGGLVGGIYDLIAGDPTKKEQNQLGALGGYETGTGEGLTTAGAGYDEAILSGDPSRIAQTLAPEISTGQQQAQQAKQGLAQFGTRSGGTAGAAQGIDAATRGNIINLVGGLQQGTAGQALGAGGNLLGQASGNINDQASLARARQQQVGQDVSGIASSVASMAMPFLGGAGAAAPGGFSPEQLTNLDMGAAPAGFSPSETLSQGGPDLSMFSTPPPQVNLEPQYSEYGPYANQ